MQLEVFAVADTFIIYSLGLQINSEMVHDVSNGTFLFSFFWIVRHNPIISFDVR